jgi:hypothetical protein
MKEATVNQRVALQMNDDGVTPTRDALDWAAKVGFVEIHPNGTWNLTQQGMVGVHDLLGNAHPFHSGRRGQARHHQKAFGNRGGVINFWVFATTYRAFLSQSPTASATPRHLQRRLRGAIKSRAKQRIFLCRAARTA